MAELGLILKTLHIIGSVLWLGAVLSLVFLLHPVWVRYREYPYFQNFRLEVLRLFLRALNIADSEDPRQLPKLHQSEHFFWNWRALLLLVFAVALVFLGVFLRTFARPV